MKLLSRMSILITAVILAPLILLLGCGAVAADNAAATVAAGGAEAGQTEAVSVTTAPVTAPAKIVEIEDIGIDPDFACPQAAADIAELPVALVAGLKITQPEFKFMLNSYKSGILLNSGIVAGSDEDVYFWTRTSSNGSTRLDEARGKVLAELHKLKVCAAIAADRAISLDQDELENINTDLLIQQSHFGGREEFERVLMDDYGITLRDYWDLSTLVSLREKLMTAERESITVSDSAVEEYYDSHQDIFGDLVRIRQILYLNEGEDVERPRTEEETLALAESTLKGIMSGDDMDRIARQNSDEPNAVVTGGEHIITRADEYEPDIILDWAFGAEVGNYTIIATAYGYYIVNLEEKIVRDYEDLKQDIRDILRENELSSHVVDWMNNPVYALKVDEEVIDNIL